MSKLSTQPVLRCKRCGRGVVVAGLQTTVPDDDAALLGVFMKGLAEKVLCAWCQRQYDYYAALGQSEDWLAGRVGGVIVVNSAARGRG